MERKALTLEIKSADKGEVEAVFSKMNEIDHEGDITLTGAFDDGAEVAIGAYGHGSVVVGGKPPVGKGRIVLDGDLVKIVGGYFMDQTAAREEFMAVKQMGGLLGWSYGFDILERGALTKSQQDAGARRALAKVSVYEASPTIVPAGKSTGTVSTKALTGHPAPMLTIEVVRAIAPGYADEIKAQITALVALRFGEAPAKFLEEAAARFPTSDLKAVLGSGLDEAGAAWLLAELELRAGRIAEAKVKADTEAADARARTAADDLRRAADAEFARFQKTGRRLGIR